MAKVSKNPLPAPLRPEDVKLAVGQTLVCRVKSVLVDVPTQQNRRGKATVILTWEHPDKGVYLNATSIENAIAGFKSDESDNWVDKFFPLIVVNAEYEDRQTGRKSMTPKLWVAPAEDWAELLKGTAKPKGTK